VKELGAAIAFACGLGYVDPGYAPTPEVAAFLDKKIDSLSCRDLAGLPSQPPNFTQKLYRYMTMSVAVVWRIAGVSWMNLSLLFGVLYGLSALAIYGLFRLALGWPLAFAGSAMMISSPLQLRYLPQLRDYAKAPFMLTLMLILGLLVVRPFTARRTLLLAAAFGAVMGIGLGFRNDLLINLLPFFVALMFFLPVPLGTHLRTKLAAAALCLALFVVCAWPIVGAYRGGSNTGHVALLGLMSHFDEPLGVTASVYDWGAPYDDGYAIDIVRSFADRVRHRTVSAMSSDYELTALEYLFLIGRHWPADLLIRAFASVLRVVELPFQVRSYATVVPQAINGALAALYTIREAVLSRASGIGSAMTAIAVLGVASSNVRVAIWLLGCLLYFAGYPALQFDARHFFFLEFIPWLALAMVFDVALAMLAAIRSAGISRALKTAAPQMRRAAAFGVAATLIIGGTAATLRAYQQQQVTALLNAYLAAPTESLTVSRARIGEHGILLQPKELGSLQASKRGDYLVVDVARRSCPRRLVPVTFRYEVSTGYIDLSQRVYVPVPEADAPYRLYIPLYQSAGQRFAGVEVIESDEGCVAGIRRVTRLDSTPVLLNLTLPPDWPRTNLYQTLTDWERPTAASRARMYTWPPDLPVADIGGAIEPVSSPVVARADIVRDLGDGAWAVDGYAPQQYSYLVQFSDAPVAAGAYLVVRGELEEGGFTVGLLQRDHWSGSINVTQPGIFEAVLRTPTSDRYALVVANCLDTSWWQRGWRYRLRSWLGRGKVGPNRFRIATVGWIQPARHSQ
jgi:hypothetical protein